MELRRDHRARRCGTSSYQYQCRLPQSQSVMSQAWHASWAPLTSLSLVGQEHGRTIPLQVIVAQDL